MNTGFTDCMFNVKDKLPEPETLVYVSMNDPHKWYLGVVDGMFGKLTFADMNHVLDYRLITHWTYMENFTTTKPTT